MLVNGKNHHTVWVHPDNRFIIQVIDQRKLPFEFQIIDLKTSADAFEAILNMTVRGAPLIGVTGAYGIYLGLVNSKEENWKSNLAESADYLKSARPTAVNLAVLIDETRPRNQGARLTAWELSQEGIQHKVIPDNAGGHLMQHGKVDLCIVGSDRTTSTGDVANKIGTYLKALAAADNNIPFYVALPSSSIDFTMKDGIHEIPIEQRDAEEVSWMEGKLENGEIRKIRIVNEQSPVANFGFDVTPAKYVTALVTERGICKANKEDILSLFPEQKNKVKG